jgi:transcriptional regulator with XRE-family HTH domain
MTRQPDSPRNPVREVRQALGLTQKQMAAKLGCSHTPVSQWERASRLPLREDTRIKLRYLARRAGVQIEL